MKKGNDSLAWNLVDSCPNCAALFAPLFSFLLARYYLSEQYSSFFPPSSSSASTRKQINKQAYLAKTIVAKTVSCIPLIISLYSSQQSATFRFSAYVHIIRTKITSSSHQMAGPAKDRLPSKQAVRMFAIPPEHCRRA